MIKKIKQNALPIALTVVVILSVFLSGSVWIKPFRYEHRQTSAVAITSRQDAIQTLSDVYQPTQLIATGGDRSQQLLYGQDQNPLRVIRTAMRDWKLHRLTRVASRDEHDYLRVLRTENALVLAYPDPVATTIFNQTFNQQVDPHRIGTINRVVITMTKTPRVYLLQDRDYQVYRLTASRQVDWGPIRAALSGGHRVNVDCQIINNHPLTTFPHPVTMPTFTASLAHQNLDNLAQTLMADSTVSSINRSTKGDVTTLTAGSSRKLTYDQASGRVQYEDYLGKDSDYTTQSLPTHLYNQLAATGVPLDQVHYDAIVPSSQTITYRSTVEGFPIFSNNDYGTVRIKANNDGVERYQLSLISLATPLPDSGGPVTLPSSVAVLNKLHQVGKLKDVHGLRLGYYWQANQRDKTVTLRPAYYLDYRGDWVRYQDLIDERGNVG